MFLELLHGLHGCVVRTAQVVKLSEEPFSHVHCSGNHCTKQTCILLRCSCARGSHSSATPKTQVWILAFWRTSNRQTPRDGERQGTCPRDSF